MKNYIELLRNLLENGDKKSDRLSLIGKQLEFDLTEGFPIIISRTYPKEVFVDNEFFLDNIVELEELINTLKTIPDNQEELYKTNDNTDFQFYSCEMKPLERMSRFNQYVIDYSLDVTGMSTEDAMKHYNFPYRKLSLIWNHGNLEFFNEAINMIVFFASFTHMIAQLSNHCVDRLIGNLGEIYLKFEDVETGLEEINSTPNKLPKLKLNKYIKNILDFKLSDFKLI